MKIRDKKLFELSNEQQDISEKWDLVPIKKLWEELMEILHPIISESNIDMLESCRNQACEHFKLNLSQLEFIPKQLLANEDFALRICTEFKIILTEAILKVFKLHASIDNIEATSQIVQIDTVFIRQRFFLFFLIKTFRKRLIEIDILEIWKDGEQLVKIYQAIKQGNPLVTQNLTTKQKFALPSTLVKQVVFEIEQMFTILKEQKYNLNENDIQAINELDIEKILHYEIENFFLLGILDDIKLKDKNSLEGRLIVLQPLFFYTHGIESQSDFLCRKGSIPSSRAMYADEYRQYLRDEFTKLNLL